MWKLSEFNERSAPPIGRIGEHSSENKYNSCPGAAHDETLNLSFRLS